MKAANWFPTRILIVDDKEHIRESMRDRIARSSERYLVETTGSGADALEKVRRTSFDVVLSDLFLKGEMDGIEVTRRICEERPETRVIVFSGQESGESQRKVLQAGAFLYLSKPIDYDELIHGIETINKIRRTEQLGHYFRILAEISYDLQSSLDLKYLADRIVQGAYGLGYQRARLYLFDSDSQTLIGLAICGGSMPAEEFAQYRIPVAARPIIGELFYQDRPVIWDKKIIVDRFGQDSIKPWMDDFDLHEIPWIDCPLFVEKNQIGNLAVDHHGQPDLPITDDDLQIMGVLAGLAAQALNKSRLFERERLANASLRSILEDVPDAVITTDLQGTITFASPSGQRILGYRPKEMTGRPAASFYTDEKGDTQAGEAVAHLIMRRLRAEGPISNMRVHVRVKDGSIVPFSLSGSLLHDDRSNEVGTLGILRDLRVLEAQSRQYRDLLEGFGYGMLLLNKDGTISFVNRKAERLLQTASEHLEGKPFTELVMPMQLATFQESLDKVLATGDEVNVNLSLQRPDQTRITLEVRLTPTRIGTEVDGVALALYDRSELSAVIQSGRLMALGQMVAGVAHEINNPLNNMLVAARSIRDRLEPSNAFSERERDYFSMIERNAGRIGEIIRLLREFARPAEFTRNPLQIRRVIEDSLTFFRTRFLHRDIYIEIDLPNDLPSVLGEERRLQQVFVNLFVNAEDAMEGQSEPKKIRIEGRSAPERVIVEVSDTGKGIPDEIREAIFDPFFTTKDTNKGTGLGLSISKSILDLHRGSIEATSNPAGRGARFVIGLPTV
ncbi:MAG TPA: PAS domain S-box protein [Thermoanaerobaculia bacterium]